MHIKLPLILSISMALAACGSDDDNASSGTSIGYKSSASGETEYLITAQDLSAENEISNLGTGEEQLGWNFFYNVGNTLFITGYENYETNSYAVNSDGEVAKLATFFYENPLQQFGSVDEELLLASDATYSEHGQRKLYTVDADTGFVVSIVDYTIHEVDTGTPGEGTVAWPTALKVRGDKLYIPFQKFDDGGSYSTPDANKAYVAIYDYPLSPLNNTPISIIEDDRTSNIGINGATTGLIETDNGDLYSFSNGAVSGGFYPPSTNPSGILRINSGEDVFDEDYFFNIEDATGGGKIFWFDHVGGNKALARIFFPTAETEASAWSGFYKSFFQHKLVIIDLDTQTITDVDNVPMHQKRYTSPIEVIDGKVLVSIETNAGTSEAPELETYVYEVDVENATAVKGAKIEGAKTVKGFFNLYN